MTGLDVQRLRESLGMSVPQFAQVLGVAHTTVYRWELAGAAEVKIDPMQLGVLTQLQDKLGKNPTTQNRDIGQDIAKALLVGGAVFALYKILDAAFNKPTPTARRTRGASGGRTTTAARSSPSNRTR